MNVLFRWEDDETCAIYVDGDYLILMRHDLHGWAGMTLLRDALVRMAEKSGGEVIIEGEEGV